MRMIPVKTKPVFRRVWVRLLMWELNWRMKQLQNDIDVWFPASAPPVNGSPWEATQTYADDLKHAGHSNLIHIAKSEATLRLDAVEDHFFMLRAAMRTRRVYSLYVMCRSTIEACAFASWVFDPTIEPAERLLRGLLLREDALRWELRSLNSIAKDRTQYLDADSIAELDQARDAAEADRDAVGQAIERIRAEVEAKNGAPPGKPPSFEARIKEMLCDDLGMPQGYDAYHRMSGVAHSRPTAMVSTWSIDDRRPSINYFNFLVYVHLALCSVAFSVGRRADCWGETPRNSKLHKIIGRVERIVAGEPGVLVE